MVQLCEIFVEFDSIYQFDANGKIYIPEINSTADLFVEQGNGFSFIKANKYTNGSQRMWFICNNYDQAKAQENGYITSRQVIIGDMADKAYAALTPENYLNNPDLGGLFAWVDLTIQWVKQLDLFRLLFIGIVHAIRRSWILYLIDC